MTVGELLDALNKCRYREKDTIRVSVEAPHTDEYGEECSGYAFDIIGVDKWGILIDPWYWNKEKDNESGKDDNP